MSILFFWHNDSPCMANAPFGAMIHHALQTKSKPGKIWKNFFGFLAVTLVIEYRAQHVSTILFPVIPIVIYNEILQVTR